MEGTTSNDSFIQSPEAQGIVQQAFARLNLIHLNSTVSGDAVDVVDTDFDREVNLRVSVVATGGARADEDLLLCQVLASPGTPLNVPLFVSKRFFKYQFQHPELGVIEFCNCYPRHVQIDHTLMLVELGAHHIGQFDTELDEAVSTIPDSRPSLVCCWAEDYTPEDRQAITGQLLNHTGLVPSQILFFGGLHDEPRHSETLQRHANRIAAMIDDLLTRLEGVDDE